MKSRFGIKGLLVAGMLAIAGLAQAQQYEYTSAGSTNRCLNNTTTTAAMMSETTFNATDYGEVGIDIYYELDAAGTTGCTFNFNRSMNGSSWPTTAPISVTVTPNGTTGVRTNLNVSVGALGYVRLDSIVAANNTAAMTNIAIYYVVKPHRRDNK